MAVLIYLDHNATTPLRPEVWAAMKPYLEERFGNPSSLHAAGRQAAEGVETARGQIAAALAVEPECVYFTAGGTEADNWALKGVVEAARRAAGRAGGVITSAGEHHAVLDSAGALARRGHRVRYLPLDARGLIDVEALLDAVEEEPPSLVSLLYGNNETGVLLPVAQIGAQLRPRGVLLHVDAVQSFGKIPVHPRQLGADLVSISAHKINGPKGTGALYVREGIDLEPLFHGGGQEAGRRPGTLNAAGIVGFGAAAQLRQAEMAREAVRLEGLRHRLQQGLEAQIEGTVVHGAGAPRLANTLSVSFRGVEAEAVLVGLDQQGVAAASGSACSSGSSTPSHVLLAMGVEPRLASGGVRFSLGWGNDEAQIDQVLDVLPPIVARLRDLSVF